MLMLAAADYDGDCAAAVSKGVAQRQYNFHMDKTRGI